MPPRVSLRAVISAIAALSVAVVAAITLGLTLTSSLAALRSVGKGQAEALLSAALLSSEQLFAVPQDTAESLQNLTRSEDWPWPSDDRVSFEYFQNATFALFVNSGWRLNSIVMYFGDNTQFVISNYYAPGRQFQRPGDYYGLIATIPTPLSAAGGNRSLQSMAVPTERTIRYADNISAMPHADPRFDAIMPPEGHFSRIYDTPTWDQQFMFATSNGQVNVNAGVYNVALFGVVENFVTFLAPLRRKSASRTDPSGVFGFVVLALGFDDLNKFVRAVRATPNTAAFAIDALGYLLASSEPAPFTVNTVVPFGAALRPGCTTTERSGDLTISADNTMSCRAHATAYGHTALSAFFAEYRGKLPAAPTVALLDTADGVHFAATAQVPMRFRGPSTHLVVLVPEQDIIGDVVRSRNVAIGATCAAFVLVAGAAFATITALLAPLGTIAERMQRAANLEDDAADESVSAMSEVAELQQAYYAMNDELNRIRSFVPQSVRVAKRGNGDDDDGGSEGELSPTGTVLDESSAAQHTADTRSQRSQSSRRTTQSKASSAQRKAALVALGVSAGSTGLTSRVATVLVANAAGFTKRTGGMSAGRVAEVIGELVGSVEAAVSSHGGVLGVFHGDHFTATFNAARPCAGHARKACSAAAAITGIGGSGGADHGGAAGGLQMKAGITSGACMVGNVGSDAAKVFATVGPAFAQAVALERMTRLYGAGCHVLSTARVCADVSTHFRFRFVDIVGLPGRRAVLVAAVLGPVQAPAAASAEGGGPGGVAATEEGDEWLYLVGNRAAADPHAAHNEAFAALHRMDLAVCDTYAELVAASSVTTRPAVMEIAVEDHYTALLTAARLIDAANEADPPNRRGEPPTTSFGGYFDSLVSRCAEP